MRTKEKNKLRQIIKHLVRWLYASVVRHIQPAMRFVEEAPELCTQAFCMVQMVNNEDVFWPRRKIGDEFATLKKAIRKISAAQFNMVVQFERIIGHSLHDYLTQGGSPIVFEVLVCPTQNGQTVFKSGQTFWTNTHELSINTAGLHLLYDYIGTRLPGELKLLAKRFLIWNDKKMAGAAALK